MDIHTKPSRTKILIGETEPIRISRGVYKKDIFYLSQDLINTDGLILDNIYDNVITYTDEILFLGNKKELYAYSIPAVKTLWRFLTLSDYNWMQKSIYENVPTHEKEAEIVKFLCLYKDLLWMILNGGSLLALDVNTGEAKKHIHQGKSNGEKSKLLDKAWFLYDAFFDEKEGKIINLFQDYYLEYDLEKGEDYFEYTTFKESSQTFGLELNRIAGHDEENIYAWEGSDNNRFAVFSRQKKEITFSEEIGETKYKFPAIRDMQYGEGKIYVLDYHNTLHVFEQE
jgi:hypothetical protein